MFHYYSDDAAKGKFGILLTKPDEDGHAWMAITTSRQEFLDAAKILEQNIVRIEAGAYPFFPQMTAVDLTSSGIRRISWNTIQTGAQFYEKGALSKEDFGRIIETIRTNTQLPTRDKRGVLGPDYNAPTRRSRFSGSRS